MRSHTPGPWYFQQVGSPGYFVIKGPNLQPLPETVENARLKAAAPDMAKALRYFLDDVEDGRIDPETVILARNALTKGDV